MVNILRPRQKGPYQQLSILNLLAMQLTTDPFYHSLHIHQMQIAILLGLLKLVVQIVLTKCNGISSSYRQWD